MGILNANYYEVVCFLLTNFLSVGGKVMKGYIRCNATFFGNYSGFPIDSNNIMIMMTELKEFEVIPSVHDEIQFEIIDNIPKQRPTKNYQLISLKEKFRVSITTSNIIIQADINVNDNKISNTDVDIFFNNVKKVYSLLYKIMGVKANRISLVTTYLSEDNNSQFETHAIPDEYFKGKNVFEWNVRSTIRDCVNLSGKEESINVVSSVSKTKGMFGITVPFPNNYEFEGVVYDIDINTIPENLNNRIDDKFSNEFYDYALKLEHSIFKGRGLYGE